MRVFVQVRPRGVPAAAVAALVLLSIPTRSVIRGATQSDADTPRRIKTAAAALPPMDLGERQLPAETHDLLLHDRARREPIEGLQPVPGRVIVKFRSGSSTASHAAAAQSVAGRVAGRKPSAHRAHR